jgi:hypothetical protein
VTRDPTLIPADPTLIRHDPTLILVDPTLILVDPDALAAGALFVDVGLEEYAEECVSTTTGKRITCAGARWSGDSPNWVNWAGSD